MLRSWLGVSRLIPLAAPGVLRRRLAQGSEDPLRWNEKLGEPTATRPEGRLVWLHAVGLGEVQALRGPIAALSQVEPGLSFLVTSTARSSGAVFAANLPSRTQHQYLPLDAPRYLARFLDHWRPALSVWAEQDLWPGAVHATAMRRIPLALVNARMNDAAFARRDRVRSLYADLYARFALIEAQDAATARHMTDLGARDVRVGLPLKAAAPDLSADAEDLTRLTAAVAGRQVWLAASTHPEDDQVALAAQAALWAQDRRWLLLLVPRDPGRPIDATLPTARRTQGPPRPDHAVWIGDSYGEMGLWLRLAARVVVGGSFGPIEGHNPWEAAALGHGILHGPHVANFAGDYARLAAAGAARSVTPADLAQALTQAAPDGPAARRLVREARAAILPLARDLVALSLG